jgi:hypothetical protein
LVGMTWGVMETCGMRVWGPKKGRSYVCGMFPQDYTSQILT